MIQKIANRLNPLRIRERFRLLQQRVAADAVAAVLIPYESGSVSDLTELSGEAFDEVLIPYESGSVSDNHR